VKVAIQAGADLVPAYHFGSSQMLSVTGASQSFVLFQSLRLCLNVHSRRTGTCTHHAIHARAGAMAGGAVCAPASTHCNSIRHGREAGSYIIVRARHQKSGKSLCRRHARAVTPPAHVDVLLLGPLQPAAAAQARHPQRGRPDCCGCERCRSIPGRGLWSCASGSRLRCLGSVVLSSLSDVTGNSMTCR